MSVLRPIWLNLAILVAFGLQVDAVFGQVFSGLQQQPGITRSTQGPHYFTIMGHIGQPNCYELPTSAPSLVTFVEFAGDLTPTAAGSIRIVRNGRSVQSVFYTEKSTERLLPGDIVVVDGKVNQGRIILRGNQNSSDDANAEVTLAITGLRDYPVVMTVPAERATIRWVTRHLGLDPAAANYVKAITQRQSVQVYPDSRLVTGTVLAFNPAVVDPSRLPDNLPVPVKAGRKQPTPTQPAQPAASLTQQQLTGPQGNQYGAAPGRARVPTITQPADNGNTQTEPLDLPEAEQTFVKQLLTDPASVPLDEPTPAPSGRAFVPQQPASSGQPSRTSSANGIGNGSASASAGSAGAATLTDIPRRALQSPPGSVSAPASESADQSAATIFSSEATRPYQSERASPEPLQPFGSSRNSLEDSQPEPRPAADISQAEAGDGNGGGFSLAMQAATLATTTAIANTTAVTNSGQAAATGNNETPPPPSSPPTTTATGPTPTPPFSPMMPVQPTSELTSRTDLVPANPATMATHSASDGSRLLPPPPTNVNWPIISILTIGLLGAIAACFLIYSIAHENPVPRVTQIDTSGRYWLDRMIENDIPIEEEAVNYPHNTQLFGKPAPLQRVDAAHRTVPRPHFSAPGGKSGVLTENPTMPGAPTPEHSGKHDTRIVRVHAGGPLRKQAAAAAPTPRPVETAAKHRDATSGLSEFAATAVFGDTAQQVDQSSDTVETAAERSAETSVSESPVASAKKPGRQFRFDTGHKTDEEGGRTASRTAGSRKPVTVQPSPVVVRGANLLDRILSSVEHEQTVARPKADASNRNKRQSDERGLS
jgi:hypothetical protein